MSYRTRRIASWLFASLAACAAAASLEPPTCTAACVDAANHLCFENGQWVPNKKLKINYTL